MLVKHPRMASLNLANEKLQHPLHFAAFQRHRGCVKIMLDADADTTVKDRKGRTPAEDTKDMVIRDAILAARKGDVQTYEELLAGMEEA